MDNDQPRIAILGAGPIGLEAALYARYLGYPVQILERELAPGASLLELADQPMPSRFAALVSTLGVAALRAQDEAWQPPAADSVLPASAYYQSYLLPLAESDLIAEVLHLQCEVLGVARPTPAAPFEVHYRAAHGEACSTDTDIVLDCTGTAGPVFCSESADPATDLPGEFLNPEADYYVLGSKSAGPGGQLSYFQALEQIRELFAILGERADLDVYATLPGLAVGN